MHGRFHPASERATQPQTPRGHGPTVVIRRPTGVLHVRIARSFLTRAVGLLATARLPADHGLLLVPCRAVHTWAMRYPLDVLFLDRTGRILAIRPGLAPWRIARCRSAHATLELAAGAAHAAGLTEGEWLPELQPWLHRP